MKNFWFIIIGIVIGFFTFFIFTSNWNLGSLLKQEKQTITHNEPISKPIITSTHTTPTQENTTFQIKNNTEDLNISTTIPTKKSPDTEDIDVEDIYKEEMQVTSEEKSIVKIKPKVSNIDTINMSQAQEVKMKIKAKEKGGTVKAKVAISHTMLTYAQAKKKGRQTHFITHIRAKVGNRIVYDASTSQFLSKNPLLKFQFKGKKGEELTVIYTQITGEVFYANKKIK